MTTAPGVSRPRLLFLSHNLPFPPDAGFKVRTYHTLAQLARGFDVTALCFTRPGEDTRKGFASPQWLSRLETFPIPQETSLIRKAWDHLRSVALRRVYTVFRYRSRAFEIRLRTLLAGEKWDLIHADSLDLSSSFPAAGEVPLLCSHHNAESLLLARRADREPDRPRRRYLRIQAGFMAAEERDWCERVALNIAVSQPDLAYLRQQAPGGKFALIPNGVDTQFFRPAASDRGGCVFVGASSWKPNREAMEFLSQRILPLVREKLPNLETSWIGRVNERDRREFGSVPGLRLVGHVPDMRPLLQEAACCVVPLRVGGGTRIKILEAWAMGKAVVSTTIGCDGLAARDGVNILIRDDPRHFAEAVVSLAINVSLRRSLGSEARRTVEEMYDWHAIGNTMIAEYQRLLTNRKPQVS